MEYIDTTKEITSLRIPRNICNFQRNFVLWWLFRCSLFIGIVVRANCCCYLHGMAESWSKHEKLRWNAATSLSDAAYLKCHRRCVVSLPFYPACFCPFRFIQILCSQLFFSFFHSNWKGWKDFHGSDGGYRVDSILINFANRIIIRILQYLVGLLSLFLPFSGNTAVATLLTQHTMYTYLYICICV